MARDTRIASSLASRRLNGAVSPDMEEPTSMLLEKDDDEVEGRFIGYKTPIRGKDD